MILLVAGSVYPAGGQIPGVSADYLLQHIDAKVAGYARAGHKVMRVEIGMIHRDSLASVYRQLYADHTYEIIAFANPEEIGDIDLKIYREMDGNYRIEMMDHGDHAEARILFHPPVSAWYRIIIDAYQFNPNEVYGRYGMLITDIE